MHSTANEYTLYAVGSTFHQSKLYKNAVSTEPNPLVALQAALKRAEASGRRNMNAMSLATVDGAGKPDVRVVLLRKIDEQGLVFFTDSRSNKARELAANPAAAACLYWEPTEEQARVTGHVETLPSAAVEADFATRPRAGQVLIWASAQSQPLDDLNSLREAAARQDASLGKTIACPSHWAGYRLIPRAIEMWRGSRDRFHERVLYERDGEGQHWTHRLLQP